eukprot:TRINITY_DN19990_c0_g1_i1.p2 TRINITY_DN19990_c0_g1~~TRINITY_DN19990_c0_g1_i1.p2  ORF type:complete len:243 (+),score=66.71 TRINITY_DN19990_c0_g1_i1:339-1067(+)
MKLIYETFFAIIFCTICFGSQIPHVRIGGADEIAFAKPEPAGKPRLTYFNGRGTAEFARLTLAAAGIEFEDVRVSNLTELKTSGKLAFGQVPLLEIDSLNIVQSHAIARYIARKAGLYGSSPAEATTIDVVLDGFLDVRLRYVKARDAPADLKADAIRKFTTVELPQWLGYFERMLAQNPAGYFAGATVSIADLRAYDMLYMLQTLYPDALDAIPQLRQNTQRVSTWGPIAAYLATRPVTPF